MDGWGHRLNLVCDIVKLSYNVRLIQMANFLIPEALLSNQALLVYSRKCNVKL